MMPEQLLLTVFLASTAVYLLFLAILHKGLRMAQAPAHRHTGRPLFLSVIIPCRNEAATIERNIAGLLAQTYPTEQFEILYVDDNSSDNTADLIRPHVDGTHIRVIRLVKADGSGAGKKQALTKGIAEARGEIIVTSDADCSYPAGWLTTIAEHFTEEIGFLSSPVAFLSGSSIFSEIQSLEFAGLVLTGAALIGLQRPVICNGANVAYRKTLFEKNGGFADGAQLSSGDDELVMRKIHASGTHHVAFLYSAEAVVQTAPSPTIGEFFSQRIRWASKGRHYHPLFVFTVLIPVFVFFCMLCLFPVFLLCGYSYLAANIAAAFMVKAGLELGLLHRGKALLSLRLRFLIFLFAEIVHPWYIVAAAVMGTFGGFSWKGRDLSK
jgi:cellulose synthase/poly-beta-1,6-N-acetylglucosamine synthase-like glycosyltransferase